MPPSPTIPPPRPETILQSPYRWRCISRDEALLHPELVVVIRQVGGRQQSFWLKGGNRASQGGVQDRYYRFMEPVAEEEAEGDEQSGADNAHSGANAGFSALFQGKKGKKKATSGSVFQTLFGFRKRFMGSSSGSEETGSGEKDEKPVSDKPKSKSSTSSGEKKKTKTWIEIKLIDELGEPIPNQQFELTLTDGSTRKGTLDGSGKIRVDDIDPGTCTIIFPGIDKIVRK